MDLLEKHFDVAFSATNGVEKLRELILTLAIRGQLVQQDPNDQPIHELLQRISEERKKLVKEKKLRESKELLEVASNNIFYKLPDSWMWVCFDDIAENSRNALKAGPFGSALKKSMYVESGFKVYGQEQVISGDEELGDYYIDKDKYQSLVSCAVKTGDILISLVGTIGKVLVLSKSCQPGIINPRLVKISLDESIDREYIKRLLGSPLVQMELSDKSHGGTMKILNLSLLRGLSFPLPPILEQRRIVAKIDQLMARCDELEKLRAERDRLQIKVHMAACDRLLTAPDTATFTKSWQFITQHFSELYSVKENVSELRKAILQLAVTGKLVQQDSNEQPASQLLRETKLEKNKLVQAKKIRKPKPLPKIGANELTSKLPEGWEIVQFGDLAIDIATGPFGAMIHKSDYIKDGVPLINPSHMIDGAIVHNPEITVTPKKAEALSSHKLFAGDIVMARRGEMGRCAIVNRESNHWLCGTGSFVLRFIPKINRQYILILFKAESVRAYLGGNSIGTTMTNLNHGILKKMPIMLPPLLEQHRIVAKVDQLMTLCDTLEQQIDAIAQKQTALLNAVTAQL